MPGGSMPSLRKRVGGSRPLTTPLPFDINPDPAGVDVTTRGLAAARAGRQAMVQRSFDEANPLVATSAITGPLPDPQWAGFFQALDDAGIRNIQGGPSPTGSTQLTGQSVQPNWMPTSGLLPGQLPTGTASDAVQRTQTALPTGSIDALKTKTGASAPPPTAAPDKPFTPFRNETATPGTKPPDDHFVPFLPTTVAPPLARPASILDALRQRGR
jgi:hypothetical protein